MADRFDRFDEIPSQNVFNLGSVTFSSNFDNGNLSKVKKVELGLQYEYRVWVAPDNQGTSYQSKQNAWFHFTVSGVPKGNILRIQIANATNHSGLYRYDMRPVYKSHSSHQKWARIKNSVRYEKQDDNSPQLSFDHLTDTNDDIIHFAFTYPYTYGMVQNDMKIIDDLALAVDMNNPECIYCTRELLIHSIDGLRIDLVTITSVNGANPGQREPNFTGLFPVPPDPTSKPRKLSPRWGHILAPQSPMKSPILSPMSSEIPYSGDDAEYEREDREENERKESERKGGERKEERKGDGKEGKEEVNPDNSGRPLIFPSKEIVFVSARVHPGEVPAQHTWKGIFDLLTDPNDLIAKELRKRYVFKMIPMLNPDGVFRGHFRMDQNGENLNRYYCKPDVTLQPSIFAAKTLIEYYASSKKLCFYLDLHAHASKRGCFIYGNVLDDVNDQIQNQLYCKLISMNSPHFEYEACLFNRDHMKRVDPCDVLKGLTAEGSGRVATYLSHNLIHSYTLECNYNMSRAGNEITACEYDPKGAAVCPPSAYDPSPEKYTPSSYAGVGRACIIALLDIRNQNPCSRISTSKFKTLDRVRQSVLEEVRSKREYRDQSTRGRRHKEIRGQNPALGGKPPCPFTRRFSVSDSRIWRSYADGIILDFEEIEGMKKGVDNKGRKGSNSDSNSMTQRIRSGSFSENPQRSRSPWLPSENHNSPPLPTPTPTTEPKTDPNSSRKNSSNSDGGFRLSRSLSTCSKSPSFSTPLSAPKNRCLTPNTNSSSTRYTNIIEDENEQNDTSDKNDKNDKKSILIPIDGIAFSEKNTINAKSKMSFIQLNLPQNVQASLTSRQLHLSQKLIPRIKDLNKRDSNNDEIKTERNEILGCKSTDEENIDSDLNKLIKSKFQIKDHTQSATPPPTYTPTIPHKNNVGTLSSQQVINEQIQNQIQIQIQISHKFPDNHLQAIIEKAKNTNNKISESLMQSFSERNRGSSEHQKQIKGTLSTQSMLSLNPLNPNSNKSFSSIDQIMTTTSCEMNVPNHPFLRVKSDRSEKGESYFNVNIDNENKLSAETMTLPLKKQPSASGSNLFEIKNSVVNAHNLLTSNIESQNLILSAIPGGKLAFNSGKISLLNKLPKRQISNPYILTERMRETVNSEDLNCERSLIIDAIGEAFGGSTVPLPTGRSLLL